MNIYHDIEKMVRIAKLSLFNKRNTTFFSSILAQLKINITEDCPSLAATDGRSLLIHPVLVKELKIDAFIGLLLHEVMHCVYQHMSRMSEHKLNKKIWNIAGDYLINGELDKLGYKLPERGMLDHKYDNKSTKEIYDILIQDPEVCTEDFVIDIISNDDLTDEEKKELEVQITNMVVNAVTQARIANDHGSIPANLARQVDKLINPVLPWNAILQNNIATYNKDDYSWRKPNRRFWPDTYIPSTFSESLKQITVGIDTSASISEDDLTAFMSEVTYIFETLKPEKLKLISFDWDIHEVLEFSEGDSIRSVALHGGGGTQVGPFLDILREDTPELALIFTDGEFSKPYLQDITTDIFWIIKNYESFVFTPSKGTVIRYES